jgi:hypothetical protein
MKPDESQSNRHFERQLNEETHSLKISSEASAPSGKTWTVSAVAENYEWNGAPTGRITIFEK